MSCLSIPKRDLDLTGGCTPQVGHRRRGQHSGRNKTGRGCAAVKVWDAIVGEVVWLVTRRATVSLGQEFTPIAPNFNTLLSLGKQL